MKSELAKVGARGIDSLPFSQGGTAQQARDLFDSGIDFVVGYLGAINATRLGYILDAGMAFMPVTFAGEYFDGALDELKQLDALGIPKRTTVWLDLEGKKSYEWPTQDLIARINEWAKQIINEGYEAGLYIGSPQPLTADELYRLKVTRYWKAPSRVVDRNGISYDGPQCGFCMYQCWPSIMWKDTGVFVDVDFIQQDFRGRLPTWVVAD